MLHRFLWSVLLIIVVLSNFPISSIVYGAKTSSVDEGSQVYSIEQFKTEIKSVKNSKEALSLMIQLCNIIIKHYESLRFAHTDSKGADEKESQAILAAMKETCAKITSEDAASGIKTLFKVFETMLSFYSLSDVSIWPKFIPNQFNKIFLMVNQLVELFENSQESALLMKELSKNFIKYYESLRSAPTGSDEKSSWIILKRIEGKWYLKAMKDLCGKVTRPEDAALGLEALFSVFITMDSSSALADDSMWHSIYTPQGNEILNIFTQLVESFKNSQESALLMKELSKQFIKYYESLRSAPTGPNEKSNWIDLKRIEGKLYLKAMKDLCGKVTRPEDAALGLEALFSVFITMDSSSALADDSMWRSIYTDQVNEILNIFTHLNELVKEIDVADQDIQTLKSLLNNQSFESNLRKKILEILLILVGHRRSHSTRLITPLAPSV